MAETTAIVMSIVGIGIGMISVTGVMLRILTTNIGKQFDASAAQMKDMKTDLGARIDDTNRRIDSTHQEINSLRTETNQRFQSLTSEMHQRFENLTSEMHQRFDRVHQELAENRERMAKLEGSLDGFLAGRRDRDAA